MELDLLNQITGSGADTVTMIVGWILIQHNSRIKKLENKV